MKEKHILSVLGQVNEDYIEQAGATIGKSRKIQKLKWGKWAVMAACLCLVVVGVMTWQNANTQVEYGMGTLMGDTEIYPTVMVNGQLYEWRKGAAICNSLPNDCVYYGDLTHIEGETPTYDSEFVSAFSVSGQIYTIPQNDDCVYLCLTTDWLNETIVVFDLVK